MPVKIPATVDKEINQSGLFYQTFPSGYNGSWKYCTIHWLFLSLEYLPTLLAFQNEKISENSKNTNLVNLPYGFISYSTVLYRVPIAIPTHS